MAIINASATDFIPFQEGNPLTINPSHSSDFLAFVETAYCPVHDANVIDILPMIESGHDFIVIAATQDSLVFGELAWRGQNASAIDLFGLTDFAGLFHGGPGSDSLIITDSATVVLAKPGNDTLSLTESAESAINPFLATSESFVLYEFALATKVSCAPLDQRLEIQLMSPADNPLTTLTLCAAEFGDIRRRDFQRINRRSRNNDLIIYRDPNWTRSDSFTMRLANLNTAQRFNLLNFLEFTTGQYVKMRDYEGNIWRGFIMNPNTVITQTGNCRYSCELQFSGAVVEPAN